MTLSSSLPIIDPTPYLPTSSSTSDVDAEARRETARALHQACRDIGFFYLRVDGYLEKSEMDEMLDVGREFFALDEGEKGKIGLDKSDGCRGYQRLHQNITQGKADHHEGLDLYAPNPYPSPSSPSSPLLSSSSSDSLRPLEGQNLYPTDPNGFRETTERWVEKMKLLGMAVMRGMADGLGMSEAEWEALRAKVEESFWVMRVIGYPPLPDGADGISCGEHKDYGCLTLLHADPIAGSLQVLSRAPSASPTPLDPPTPTDGQWIHADPIPGCIVVNIGSMWEIWSGGLYPATLHRVVHKSQMYRVSVPFFFEPNFDARISVLEAARRKGKEEGRAVKGDHEEVVYGEFLLQKVGGNFKY